MLNAVFAFYLKMTIFVLQSFGPLHTLCLLRQK